MFTRNGEVFGSVRADPKTAGDKPARKAAESAKAETKSDDGDKTAAASQPAEAKAPEQPKTPAAPAAKSTGLKSPLDAKKG